MALGRGWRRWGDGHVLTVRRPSFLALGLLFVAGPAWAQDAPDANAEPGEEPKPEVTEAPTPAVVPPDAPQRQTSLVPKPAEPPPDRQRFTADPVGDGGVIIISAMLGTLAGLILDTGEIRPQQISPTFRTSQLLKIDRGAISQSLDSNAGTLSNVGAIAAYGYAALDTVLDGFRVGKTAAFVDGIMYVESFLVTQAVTSLTKIAFRRPRPIAYIERNEYLAAGGDPNTYDNAETDSSLSFISGHSSQTAAVSAAATYIAFARSPKGSPRPWLTLAGGTLLTTFVAYERVRGGSHFPTDVMAGAAVGAGVGALVVHLHREESVRQRPVWIGVAPVQEGATLTASGFW